MSGGCDGVCYVVVIMCVVVGMLCVVGMVCVVVLVCVVVVLVCVLVVLIDQCSFLKIFFIMRNICSILIHKYLKATKKFKLHSSSKTKLC